MDLYRGGSLIMPAIYENQHASIVDLIACGEIGGLVNGQASVYLNGTALLDDANGNITGRSSTANISGTSVTGAGSLFADIDLNDGDRYLEIKGGGGSSTLAGALPRGLARVNVNSALFQSKHTSDPRGGSASVLSSAGYFVRIPGAGPDGTEYRGIVRTINSSTNALIWPLPQTSVANGTVITVDEVIKISSITNNGAATLVSSVPTSISGGIVRVSSASVDNIYNIQNSGKNLAYDNVKTSFFRGTRFGEEYESSVGSSQSAGFVYQVNQPLKLVNAVNAPSGQGTQSPSAGALVSSNVSLGQYTASEIDRLKVNIKFPGGLRHIDSKGKDVTAYAEFQVVFKYTTEGASSATSVLVHGRDYGGSDFLQSVPNWSSTVANSSTRGVGLSLYKYPGGGRVANGGNTGLIQKKGNNPAFIATYDVDVKKYQPFSSWSLEVRRLSPEGVKDYCDDNDAVLNATIDSYEAIIENKFNYATSAYAVVGYSAEDFTTPPSRSYHIYGKKIKVPSNYITREETGTASAKYTRTSAGADSNSYVPWTGSFRGDESLSPTHVNFRKVYCNNPAWVFYDILTDKDYGLGQFISEDDIDKFSLYQIARYCDELVSDGKGGQEPRFSCNVYLSTIEESYKVLKDLASSFRGMLAWIDGKIVGVQDSPKEAVYTFTKANVEQGVFEYTYTGQRARVNQINVTWNNPDEFYKKTILTVEDTANIVLQGKVVSQDIVAFGCTSESQASRLAEWHLYTDTKETEIVSFTTGINASFLRPGDIINIQDKDDQNIEASGRVSSGSTTSTIALDREVDFGPGNTAGTDCKLHIIFPGASVYLAQDSATIGTGGTPPTYTRGAFLPEVRDEDDNLIDLVNNPPTAESAVNYFDNAGNHIDVQFSKNSRVEVKDITNTGTTASSITVSGAFSQAPLQDYIWAITRDTSDSSNLKTFRVAGLAEDGAGKYSISATQYDELKFDEIDVSIPTYTTDYIPATEASGPVPPPSGVSLEMSPIGDPSASGQTSAYQGIIGWTPPTETYTDSSGSLRTRNYRFIERFEISHDLLPNGSGPANMTTVEAPKGSTSFAISNVAAGSYTVKVRTVNTLGAKSAWEIANVAISSPLISTGNIQSVAQGGDLSAPFNFNSTTGVFTINSRNFRFTPPAAAPIVFSNATSAQRTESFSGMSSSDTMYLYFDSSSSTNPLRSFVVHTDETVEDIDGNETEASYFKERAASNNGLLNVSGTVSTVSGSDRLIGSSTTFTDISEGQLIKVTSAGAPGTETAAAEYKLVRRVISDTELQAGSPFTRTVSGVNIYTPAFNPDKGADAILGEVTFSSGEYSFDPYLSSAQPKGGYSALLGHESHVFQADPAGNVSSVAGADFTVNVFNGDIRYYYDNSSDPADNTYTVGTVTQSPSNGLTLSTGTVGSSPALDFEVDITAVLSSNDSGTLSIPITINHGGPVFNKTFSYSKARAGIIGSNGTKTALVYAYQRSSSAITSNPGAVTVSLETGQITTGTLANSWSKTIPSGTAPLYVVAASAAGTGTSDTIGATEWSSPVILVQNGQAGDPGLNSATVRIYKRNNSSTSSGSLPSGNTTYTFSSGNISFTTSNGWTSTVPSTGGGYLWTSQATAASTTSSDTIASSEWAASSLIAQDGSDGPAGTKTALVYAYQRSSSAITSNPGSVEVSLQTGKITTTSLSNGWQKDIPSGNSALYIVAAVASGTGTSDTVGSGEWSSPVILSQNGEDGIDGFNSATVRIYKKNNSSSSSGSLPSGNTTYTFSSGNISFTTANGWSSNIPSTGGAYLWTSQAAAISRLSSDTIASSEWAPSSLLAQDGTDGAAGLRTVQGYLYYEKSSGSVPTPTGNLYTFSTGVVSGGNINDNGTTNCWRNSPRPQVPTSSNTHHTIRYFGTETTAGSSSFNVTYSSIVAYTNFTGVVTFSNGTFSSGPTAINGATAATSIDGANIKTGSIDAEQLTISSTASSASTMFFDGSNTRIDIKDSNNVLRVRLGKLT